jgi:polar amino acid transport system substrate-binding protein
LCGIAIVLAAMLCAACVKAGDESPQSGASNYEAYSGKRFSILTGSIFDTIADDTFHAAEKLYFNNTVEEIEAVRLGKTDAALLDDVAAAQSLQSGQYEDLIALPVDLPELDLPYGVFSTQQGIIDKYNAFLAEIEADGTLADMQDRWLKTYSLDTPMPDIPLSPENGTLKVAIMATYPPFTFVGENGAFAGFDIEQMRRFAAWMGMDVEFADMDFAALIAYVQSGKADMGGSVYATEERKKSFIFGNPDYVSKTVLVVQGEAADGATETARDHTWFAGKTVGVDVGTAVLPALEKIGAEAAYFQSPEHAMGDIRNGKIAGYCNDLSAMRLRVSEKGNEDLEVIEVPASYYKGPMGAIASFESQALIDEFNVFLSAIKAEGTLADMQTRWLDTIPDLATPMPALTYTGEKGILKVGTTGAYVPFDYVGENAELKGYSIELMNRFAAYAGYIVEYQTMDFGGLIAAVSGGRADMAISNHTITEERKKSVLFTDSIYDDTLGIITLKLEEEESESVGFVQWLKTGIERNLLEENRYKLILKGLGATLMISLLAQILGTVLGTFLCWVTMRKSRLARGLAHAYSSVIHGLPVVVLLMISYYLIFGRTDIMAELIAVCAFALVKSSDVALILSGAIATVDRIEIEAARSMGFSAFGAFRAVTLPQAIRRAMPGYCNGFVELVKSTAIVGYISIQDLTRAGDIIRSRTYDAFFPLILVALMYLVFTLLMVWIFRKLVARFGTGRTENREV